MYAVEPPFPDIPEPDGSQPPALCELGIGLASRVDECVATVRRRMSGATWVGVLPTPEWLERADRTRWFATLLIARWLYTGEPSEPAEMGWLSERGAVAAEHGVALSNVIRGTLIWRDTLLRMLREEVKSRYVARDRAAEAVDIVMRSCDTSLVSAAAAHDRVVSSHRLVVADGGPLPRPPQRWWVG